jgi:hypothetical protein
MLLFLADELTEFNIQRLKKKLRVPLLSKISPDPSFSKRGNISRWAHSPFDPFDKLRVMVRKIEP